MTDELEIKAITTALASLSDHHARCGIPLVTSEIARAAIAALDKYRADEGASTADGDIIVEAFNRLNSLRSALNAYLRAKAARHGDR